MSSVELHVTFDKSLFLTLVVKANALTELPQKPRLTLLGMRQTPKPTVLTRNTHLHATFLWSTCSFLSFRVSDICLRPLTECRLIPFLS